MSTSVRNGGTDRQTSSEESRGTTAPGRTQPSKPLQPGPLSHSGKSNNHASQIRRVQLIRSRVICRATEFVSKSLILEDAQSNEFRSPALAPLRACEWVVYAKHPFAGPEALLAYVSRYTHRVSISN